MLAQRTGSGGLRADFARGQNPAAPPPPRGLYQSASLRPRSARDAEAVESSGVGRPLSIPSPESVLHCMPPSISLGVRQPPQTLGSPQGSARSGHDKERSLTSSASLGSRSPRGASVISPQLSGEDDHNPVFNGGAQTAPLPPSASVSPPLPSSPGREGGTHPRLSPGATLGSPTSMRAPALPASRLLKTSFSVKTTPSLRVEEEDEGPVGRQGGRSLRPSMSAKPSLRSAQSGSRGTLGTEPTEEGVEGSSDDDSPRGTMGSSGSMPKKVSSARGSSGQGGGGMSGLMRTFNLMAEFYQVGGWWLVVGGWWLVVSGRWLVSRGLL